MHGIHVIKRKLATLFDCLFGILSDDSRKVGSDDYLPVVHAASVIGQNRSCPKNLAGSLFDLIAAFSSPICPISTWHGYSKPV